MELAYVTIGGKEPYDKPRVYFSCHPDDFDRIFPAVAEDILKYADCAIWYDPDPGSDVDLKDWEEILGEMQLVVFGVTSKFLKEPSRAKDIDLPAALKLHVPVLPITLEEKLGNAFSKASGGIQAIYKYNSDPTALPYEEVLAGYLKAVLGSTELRETVREAFDAYIFMSYRKKDRKHALRLMRLIHANEKFRDFAIWYDEFLVPGEEFHDGIDKAFAKSSLFAMTVTPHLEEANNFVMREEYPRARDRKKDDENYRIIPVEMYGPEDGEADKDWRIDQEKLKGKDENGKDRFRYQEITDLEDEHRPKELNQALLDALEHIAKKEHDGSARHRFFIGLAYLHGIDVEVDRRRAVAMLTEAATHPEPFPEAAATLADLYADGNGVPTDLKKAVYWQGILADQYSAEYQKHHDPDEHRGYGTLYFRALRKLSDLQKEAGMPEEAIASAARALDVIPQLEEEVGIREMTRDRAMILNRLGTLYREKHQYSRAQKYYEEACTIYRRLAQEISTAQSRRDLSVTYEQLGDLSRRRRDLPKALDYYKLAKELRERQTAEEASAASRRDLSAILTKLGNIGMETRKPDEAELYYDEALTQDWLLAREIQAPQAWDDYAVSLSKMGDLRKEQGRRQDAAHWYEEALETLLSVTEESGSLTYQAHLAAGYEKLASARKYLERKEEAAYLYRKGVELRTKLYEASQSDRDAHSLAVACFNASDHLEDPELLKKAYGIWDTLSKNIPEYGPFRDNAKKILMMNTKMTIDICSQEKALELAKDAPSGMAVISITSKEDGDVPFDVPVLHLKFNDLTAETDSEGIPYGRPMPEAADLCGLKAFLDDTLAERLLIHCWEGESRSAAVAAAVYEYRGGRDVLRTAQEFSPNPVVYDLACQELSVRPGTMRYTAVSREDGWRVLQKAAR